MDRREFLKGIVRSTLVGGGISGFALFFNMGAPYRYKPLYQQSQKIVEMKGGEKSFFLRPPGARGEEDFLKKCIKCYLCVEVCPIQAIKVAGREAGIAADTPYIIPEVTGCDLCLSRDAMMCNEICPTDALEKIPTDDVNYVFKKLKMGEPQNMGVAILDKRVCYAWTKVSLCWACYEICPYKGKAVTTGDPKAPTLNTPTIHPDKCVGCGLCVEICPVPQKAIKIVSQEEKEIIEAAIRENAREEEESPAQDRWSFEVDKTESKAHPDTENLLEKMEEKEGEADEGGDEWKPSANIDLLL